MRLFCLTILSVLLAFACSAQFTQAELGVNGLTCSACTRSVEMSLRKLNFVKDVQMNLDNTKGTIIFKEGSHISAEKIAKAVVDAGFSVRYLQATYKTDSILRVSDNYCLSFGDASYQFIKVTSAELKTGAVLKFIGKEFLPPKEYRQWKADLKPVCKANTTYFVTL